MSRHTLMLPGRGWLLLMHRLLGDARLARRERHRDRFFVSRSVHAPAAGAPHRRRASMMVERMLATGAPGVIECARFFARLATRLQLASDVIQVTRTSVQSMRIGEGPAGQLALVIAELVFYLEAAVPEGGTISIYLAIAKDGDRLIVGVAAEGDVNPVSSHGASAAMLRARRIVELMGGDFQRGQSGGRLLFGLTFPAEILMDD